MYCNAYMLYVDGMYGRVRSLVWLVAEGVWRTRRLGVSSLCLGLQLHENLPRCYLGVISHGTTAADISRISTPAMMPSKRESS